MSIDTESNASAIEYQSHLDRVWGTERERSNRFARVNANLFTGRSYREITRNGQAEQWFSLKGGLDPKKKHEEHAPTQGVIYEVLYNPATNEWMKIVPPYYYEDPQQVQIMESRLQRSAEIAQVAFDIAGLDREKFRVSGTTVSVNGKDVYGFITPHIGPSLKYCHQRVIGVANSQRLRNSYEAGLTLVSRSYKIAYLQAVRLYKEYGYCMDDPNPGNILLNIDDKVRVVLIDFSNRIQSFQDYEQFTGMAPISLEVLANSEEDPYLVRLHRRFQEQCRKNNIQCEF